MSKVAILVINLQSYNSPSPIEAILPRDYNHWIKDEEIEIKELKKIERFAESIKDIPFANAY